MNSEKTSKAPVTAGGEDQPVKIGSVEEIVGSRNSYWDVGWFKRYILQFVIGSQRLQTQSGLWRR